MNEKSSCPVLRGRDSGNTVLLLDNLNGADLRNIKLYEAEVINAHLSGAILSRASLRVANFSGSELNGADFRNADLMWANLSGANLCFDLDPVNPGLDPADFRGAELSEAKFSGADLCEVDFSGANLGQTDIEDARSLEDTYLHGVIGMTKKQLEACKAKGAIIDEDSTLSSSQSDASASPSSQGNDVQVPSAPSAQGSVPIPDADGNSAASSKPDQES